MKWPNKKYKIGENHLCRSVFLSRRFRRWRRFFSHGIFFHRISRNLFGNFLLRRLFTDFRGCDLSGRCRYPLRLEKVPQISQIYTDFSWDVFFSHADFADDADFFSWDFFIHRMPRNLFGGWLLRRLLTDFRGCDLYGRCIYPLRVENVPQISQIYTDFSWDVFFVTQISQMTQIFFSHGIFFSSDDTEFIRRIPAAAITHGFSQMRPVRSLQIPPETGQRDSPEIP